MILVIALTQFVFISLGIMALKIMVMASTNDATIPPHVAQLNAYGIWLFCIPFAWMLLAQCAVIFSKGPIAVNIARVTGVILCVLIFVVYVGSVFFVS